MKQLVLVVALFMVVGSAMAAGPCDPSNIGVADKATIDGFVRAFREALASSDPTRLAVMMKYPLQVNSIDPEFQQVRSVFIKDADDFLKRSEVVFSKAFRTRILKKLDDLICETALLRLASGNIWASTWGEGGRLLVHVVNNDEVRWPNMTAGELLRCETADQLIVVDRPRDRIRYRAWARGASKGTPSVIFEGGGETTEGTGICRHPVWRFPIGADKVDVSVFGCGTSEDDGVLAFLSILKCGEDFPSIETRQVCREPAEAGDAGRAREAAPKRQ